MQALWGGVVKCSVKKEGSFKSWSSRTIILSADAVMMLSGDALLQQLSAGPGEDDGAGGRSIVSLKQVAKFKPTDVFYVDAIRGYSHLGYALTTTARPRCLPAVSRLPLRSHAPDYLTFVSDMTSAVVPFTVVV